MVHLVFLIQDHFVAWSLTIRLDWLMSEPQRATCLCLLGPGLTSSYHYALLLFPWVLGVKLGFLMLI